MATDLMESLMTGLARPERDRAMELIRDGIATDRAAALAATRLDYPDGNGRRVDIAGQLAATS